MICRNGRGFHTRDLDRPPEAEDGSIMGYADQRYLVMVIMAVHTESLIFIYLFLILIL